MQNDTNAKSRKRSQTEPVLAERQRLYETLQRSEERYRRLFENSPISLWEEDLSDIKCYLDNLREAGITDFRAYFDAHPKEVNRCARMVRILDVNQATVKLYQADNKQQLLANLTHVFTKESYPLFKEELVALAEGQTTFKCDAINRTFNGDILHVVLSLSILPGGEDAFPPVLIAIQDVTSLKQTAQEMQQHSERRRILHEIDRAILEVQAPEEIAQAALRRLQQLIPAWASGVSLFNPQPKTLTLLSAVMVDETNAYANYLTPGITFPITLPDVIPTLRRGKAYIVEDVQTLPYLSKILGPFQGEDKRSLVHVPLILRQELIGTLSLVPDSPAGLSQEHIEITQEVADSLAIAIHNAQLLADERTARIQTETLREVTGILSTSRDERQIPNLVLEQLARVVDFKNASVMMVAGNRYDVLAYQGDSPEIVNNLPLEIGRLPLLQEIQETRAPIIVPDTHADSRWIHATGYEHIRSWLGIPLISQDDVIGFLTLDHEILAYYSQREAELALAFANQAALAIENARLFNRTQRHAQELEQRVAERTQELSALYEVTAVANKYLDLHTILEHALDSALRAVHCQAGAIQILDASEGPPRLAVHTGLSPQLMDYIRSPDAAGQTLAKGKPVIVPDFIIDSTAKTTTSYLSVPMQIRGETIGLLCIFGDAQKEFTVEEVALMASIADHVAVAVENTRLRQQAEQVAVLEERERLARELHDSVTQSLYSLALFTEAAHERALSGDLADVRRHTTEINLTAQQALREMRLLLYELRTTTLAQAGLVAALRHRLDAVEERAGVKMRLIGETVLDLPAPVEETFFRIAQEALNNALKHGEVTAVTIRIQLENSRLVMTIEDDGRGFDPIAVQTRGGMGLNIMRERAEKLGGILTIQSTLGQGTTVTVTAVINEEEITL